jgi:very-short-patch-repair endonuclease
MSSDAQQPHRPVAAVIDGASRRRLGLTTRPELLDLGLSERELAGARRSGLLIPLQAGVYRVAGTPDSLRRDLVAAVLAAGPGSVVSHRAALWIWRLTDERPPVELTVPTGSCPKVRGAVLHRSTDLRVEDQIQRRGVWVTRPARTLVDLGAVASKARVSAAVELALVRRLATVTGLRAMVEAVGGRGRRGVGVLRAVLDERALGDVRAESMLEPLMARLLRSHGVGPVLFQPEIVLEGRLLRPDFSVPRALLVVEIDGLSAHGSREALDHDLERQNLFMRHGYVVLRYTATHLRRPARVAAEILATARSRTSSLQRI